MTTIDLVMLLFVFLLFFVESGGQTPRNLEGPNRAGNVKGSNQNFQLSDLVNILVSVTGTSRVLCILLHSSTHKSLL